MAENNNAKISANDTNNVKTCINCNTTTELRKIIAETEKFLAYLKEEDDKIEARAIKIMKKCDEVRACIAKKYGAKISHE